MLFMFFIIIITLGLLLLFLDLRPTRWSVRIAIIVMHCHDITSCYANLGVRSIHCRTIVDSSCVVLLYSVLLSINRILLSRIPVLILMSVIVIKLMKRWVRDDNESVFFSFVASYTGSSSDEDEQNPREKSQVRTYGWWVRMMSKDAE